jgi:subtilisin
LFNKKIGLLFAIILALSITFGLAGQSFGASSSNENGPVRYIVVFDSGINPSAKDALVRQFGGVVEKPIAILGNANVVFLPPGAVQALSRSGKVLRAEEDAVVYAVKKPAPTPPPPPPPETLPWGIEKINADDAWPFSTGEGIKVAIIDTGIDRDHPDLVNNIKGGQNFVAIRGKIDPDNWDDDNGHGTHVAGIVAAEDNEIGVIGVAPDASLYAVKVLNKKGSGYVSDIILGLQWAVAENIQVVNMSLGTTSDVQSLHDACDIACNAGIVLVAAAGNSGDANPDDDVEYPARYSSVIAVAATDDDNLRAYWSSDGPEVDLSAPGVSIYSTYKGGTFTTLSGTSMASPHVAGTAATLLADSPSLTPDAVRIKLQDTAHDLGASGSDNYYGSGLVDAYAAIQ